jgi:16S rRNA (adenine1518-N6/adenine1519-N6)-dimethyltransferase
MIKLKAQKSLGQNFLTDPKAHQRIVKSLDPQPDDVFIEVGPGTGLLTKHLLDSPLKKLIAYELDTRAVPELEREFAEQGSRFEVVEQDFLKVDIAKVSEREQTTLRVVGNIPYYITSPIIFKLLDERAWLRDATLLVQFEVAERLAAVSSTKEYGIPTVLTNFFGEVKFLFKVPAGAFRPVPRVDSAVIRIDLQRGYFARKGIEPPEGFDFEFFRKMVRTLFGMRRKTVRNNLKGLITAGQLDSLESSPVRHYLELRAEAMNIPDFIELSMAILRAA